MRLHQVCLFLLAICSVQATFVHKCHDCTDESCDDLIPTDLTGKCSTKAHGKCFIRQDPNGLTYRGCADQRHWPELDHSYVGCRLQRYGSWDSKKVLWCFCDFDLCNTNVTAVREVYQGRSNRDGGGASPQQATNNRAHQGAPVQQNVVQQGRGVGKSQGYLGNKDHARQQQRAQSQHVKSASYSNQQPQHAQNFQHRNAQPQNNNNLHIQQLQSHNQQIPHQQHQNNFNNQQPHVNNNNNFIHQQALLNSNNQMYHGNANTHQQLQAKGGQHQQQGNNNGQIHRNPQQGQGQTSTKVRQTITYNNSPQQKTTTNTKGSRPQKTGTLKQKKTKSQYYFKKPVVSQQQKSYNPKSSKTYAHKSYNNGKQQQQQKSMKTKQQFHPIVIVPLEPPQKTFTHGTQGGQATKNTQMYHQKQQHHAQGVPSQGNNYAQSNNQGHQPVQITSNVNNIPHSQGHQQGHVPSSTNNIPHGQPSVSNGMTQHQGQGNQGQYLDQTASGSGHQGIATGGSGLRGGAQILHPGESQVQDLHVVATGPSGKEFWSNVIQALLNGEGVETEQQTGGAKQENGNRNNQVTCAGGQVWTECGGCDLTCAGVQPCLAVCVPKCQCPKGLPVLHNGVCIATCPTGQQSSDYNGGGFLYPGDTAPWDYGITIDTNYDNNGGQAKEITGDVTGTGDVISQTGQRQQAPINIVCSSNQIWTSCGSACLATCDNYLTLTCIRSCVAGCHCPPKLPVWHNGACIGFETCPEGGQAVQPPTGCPGDQVWVAQGRPCTPTCETPTPLCPRRYVSRCQCPQEAPLFHNGLCVRQDQCPGQQTAVCRHPQVYMECGSACVATCANYRGLVCTLQCKAGCHCPLSAPIWENNDCIKADQCPDHSGQQGRDSLGLQTRQGPGLTVNQGQIQGQSGGFQGGAFSDGSLGFHGDGVGQGQSGGQGAGVHVHGQVGVQGRGAGIQGQGFQGHIAGGQSHGVGVHGRGVAVQGQGFSLQGQGGQVTVQRDGIRIQGQSRIGIGIGVEKQGPETGSENEVDSGFDIIRKGNGYQYSKGGCYAGACHHICSVQKNQRVCSCRQGYRLHKDGQTCTDEDECSSSAGVCSQVCTNTPGSYHCSCLAGYRLQKDGNTCTDMNECQVNNGGCSHTCQNTDGSYQCRCPQGYTLTNDLHTCMDTDECQSASVRCQQACENTEGSYRCTCSHGYVLNPDGWTCDDVNECDAKSHGCEHYCMNKQGAYSCMCMAGYQLDEDQHSCADVDECTLLAGGGCSHQCTNTAGSFLCACPPGYSLALDGRACTDINECENKNGGCMEICENSQGSYSCRCQPGHTLTPDGRSCRSLDTCTTNNGGCSQLCETLPTGSRCGCRDGYKLDQDEKTCIDIDECSVKNGGCGQLCVNTLGSYSCVCTRGYRTDVGRKLCLDVDECLNQNGGCADGCENLLGSFRCTCPYGYTVAPDGFNCQDVNECQSLNGGCADLCMNTEGSFECACRGDLFRLSTDARNCEPLCPDGFIKSDFINSCYRVFQDTDSVKNVTDAQETCQSLHPLAGLVDIESQQERLVLAEILNNNPVMLEGWQGWWTSGVYRPETTQFQWNSGSYIENDSLLWGFKKTPYLDTCVWILQIPVYDYTVGNFDCKTESGFICEIKVPSRSLPT